jgi:hypothetical protein
MDINMPGMNGDQDFYSFASTHIDTSYCC